MLFAMSDLALSTTAPFPSLSAMVAQTGRFRGGFLLLLAAITGVLTALVVAFVGWATQGPAPITASSTFWKRWRIWSGSFTGSGWVGSFSVVGEMLQKQL